MNSPQSDQESDDDQQCQIAISKMDVYDHERLAYTEAPVANPVPQSFFRRMSARLKAMYCWVHSR